MYQVTRKNRITKTMITLTSAKDAGLCDGGGATKWYTICEDHLYALGHESQPVARGWFSSPHEWCETCIRKDLSRKEEEVQVEAEERCRAECVCGWHGKWFVNGNDAIAAGERHYELESEGKLPKEYRASSKGHQVKVVDRSGREY